MAKSLGRDAILKINNVKVAAIKTKSLAINNTPVDMSDDDSGVWRELWAVPGNKTVELSGAGLLSSTVNLAIAMQVNTVIEDCTLEVCGKTISGDFFLATFNVGAESSVGVTCDIKLQSAGACTIT